MRITKSILAVILIFFALISFTNINSCYAKAKKHKSKHTKVIKKPEQIIFKPTIDSNNAENKAEKPETQVIPELQKENVDKPPVSKYSDIFSLLSFNELKELSSNNHPQGELLDKVNFALNTPVVDNSIHNVADYKYKNDVKLGDFIRIASWNIARGMNLQNIEQIFINPEEMFSKLSSPDDVTLKEAKDEQEILKSSDVIILNEVDAGMPRTGYKNVSKELAEKLNYNYAFGVEFLEVDPVHLGLQDYKWSEERFLYPNVKKISIDETKYKGFHGSAILSKFPLKNVRIVRLPDTYDWFKGEKKRLTELEFLKRNAANLVFKEEMLREIRIGGRMALLADIHIPNQETPITIIALHLENRTIPKNRQKQISFLLKSIYNIKNPVIIGGDFNTTCNDGSPTGIRKEIKKRLKDPNFLARTALSIAVPAAAIANAAMNATDFARTYRDPSVKSIPIIAPNKERDLFDIIRDFRFADGNYFDFRGTKGKVSGSLGLLADSNERIIKGFKPTFIFERPIVIGKYKLDWFFVKSYLYCNDYKNGPYKFAPHYGRTLFELNYIFKKPLSDHVPITVDLPVNEPVMSK